MRPHRMLGTLASAALLILGGCQKPSPPTTTAEEPAFRKPTATEVFELRTKCGELGQKLALEKIVGAALRKNQISHYDPKTNRCYVELRVISADLNQPRSYFAQYLYDGQTGDLLVACSNDHGTKSGEGYGAFSVDTYEAAVAKIAGVMQDDRTQ